METIVRISPKGTPITDSRKVAVAFGKSHGNVLQAIGRLECDAEFNRLNFHSIEYRDGRNRKQRAVVMTRDGFALLVMGFTGAKAAKFKQEYIEQFNRMEAELKAGALPPVSPEQLAQPEVQRELSKSVAAHNWRIGGVGQVVDYARESCRLFTGRRPSEWKVWAKQMGYPAKWRTSGREVVRHADPPAACLMSAADDLVRRGVPLDQAAQAANGMRGWFALLLQTGARPKELGG